MVVAEQTRLHESLIAAAVLAGAALSINGFGHTEGRSARVHVLTQPTTAGTAATPAATAA
jgi:hypothetical protein